MTVIADASPLQYAVEIGVAHVLFELYGRIVFPLPLPRRFVTKAPLRSFVDEPILSAFGSSTYVSVTRDDTVAKLGEVIEAVHAEGALAGVHCCGNTEWPILIDAGVDILNFDAFDYGDTILLYPEAFKSYLKAGKALAFGIVPTNSAKIHGQTADSLTAKFCELVEKLAKVTKLDTQQICHQALVTPSCGTGSLPVADAELVFKTLHETSGKLRQKIGAPALAGSRT